MQINGSVYFTFNDIHLVLYLIKNGVVYKIIIKGL